MRRRSIFVAAAAGVCALVVSAYALAVFQESRPVESLLPANAVMYLGWDGTDRHKSEWEKTSAYEALDKSGLVSTLVKIALTYVPGKTDEQAVRSLLTSIGRKGISVAATLPKQTMIPNVVVVLHDAGALASIADERIPKLIGESAKFESLTVRGRKITRTHAKEPADLEFAWWNEGGHLLFTFGQHAVDAALDVAEGKTPSITTSANWHRFREDRNDFTPAFCGWLDMGAIRARYADVVLQEKSKTEPRFTLTQLFQILGVDRVGVGGMRLGFHDQAVLTDVVIDAPASRTGLLALADQRSIVLADLPPLAKGTSGFTAFSFDFGKAYDVIVKLVHDIARSSENDAEAKVDAFLNQLPAILGFDLKHDLLEPMGPVTCAFADNSGALFGFGLQIAIQVRDPQTLKKTLKTAFDKLQEHIQNGFAVSENEKFGRTVQVLDIGPMPFHPALCVDKSWLFIGLSPQAVEASLMRVDGKLDVWKPSTAEQQALESIPKQFQGMSLSNPRSTYELIATYLPLLISGIDQGVKSSNPEHPLLRTSGQRMALLSDLPPIELMTRSMFPNASAWTVDDRGIHYHSRDSAPGLISGSGGVFVGAVGVALLLPAVQAAREAARRTQSRNNSKQLILGLHNYHDINGHFPAGTHPNQKLKPEKRLSWMADSLPYIEQSAVHKGIDFTKAWDDPVNRQSVTTEIPIFRDPSARQVMNGPYPVTNYVGVAGLGVEGPTLPVTSPKAGCFAYDRVTRIEDITDGTSTTIITIDVSKDSGSWAAGGRPTIRPSIKKPYINGPDGFGGNHPGTTMVGMADGSVHAISEKIDPETFQRMITICGGKPVTSDGPQGGQQP